MQSVCLDVQFSFLTMQNEFNQVAQLMRKETMCMSSLAAMILHLLFTFSFISAPNPSLITITFLRITDTQRFHCRE